MPQRKAKAPRSALQSGHVSQKHIASEFFPFARYTSVVGVHTSLLAFSALFLPQSTYHFSQFSQQPNDAPDFLKGLTADPIVTLAWICAGTAILQGWWGGWMKNWAFEFSSSQNLEGADTDKVARVERDRAKFADLYKAWLATLASSFGIYVILVFLGAPIFSHHLPTYLLSFLLSLLLVFPPAYTFTIPSLASDTPALVNRLNWVRLFAEFTVRNPIERAIVYPVIGTVLGAWMGTFAIALDWGRPWQAWPLTPTAGAITGYIVGSLTALAVSGIRSLADEHIRSQQPNKIKTG